jgi:hypothetical protein
MIDQSSMPITVLLNRFYQQAPWLVIRNLEQRAPLSSSTTSSTSTTHQRTKQQQQYVK